MIYARYTVWINIKDKDDGELTDEETEILEEQRMKEARAALRAIPRVVEWNLEEVEVD